MLQKVWLTFALPVKAEPQLLMHTPEAHLQSKEGDLRAVASGARKHVLDVLLRKKLRQSELRFHEHKRELFTNISVPGTA